MPQPLADASVLILAGGRGQRLGGRDKGLVEWRGAPLIAHLHRVVRPLTDDLIVSCNRHFERYRPWADRLVSDATPDHPGPLAGILAGLAVSRHPWTLLLPCDAARVDAALLHLLLDQARAANAPAMAFQGEHWQPLFAALHTRVLVDLQAAWDRGERSPRAALAPLGPVAVTLAEDDPRLANLNDPASLAAN